VSRHSPSRWQEKDKKDKEDKEENYQASYCISSVQAYKRASVPVKEAKV
jgi:hypothetical protein